MFHRTNQSRIQSNNEEVSKSPARRNKLCVASEYFKSPLFLILAPRDKVDSPLDSFHHRPSRSRPRRLLSRSILLSSRFLGQGASSSFILLCSFSLFLFNAISVLCLVLYDVCLRGGATRDPARSPSHRPIKNSYTQNSRL